MGIAVIGIDLGKNLCSAAGMDGSGQVLIRCRMRREVVVGFVRQWPGCIVPQLASWVMRSA